MKCVGSTIASKYNTVDTSFTLHLVLMCYFFLYVYKLENVQFQVLVFKNQCLNLFFFFLNCRENITSSDL